MATDVGDPNGVLMIGVYRSYHPVSIKDQEDMAAIKAAGISFLKLCDTVGASRELSLAKNKIEEAVMWATKHVTGNQL